MVFNKICTPNKTARNSKLFYERKGKFYSFDRYENLSPLNNRINLVIVNCLQHSMSMYTKIKFSWTDNWK